MNGPNSQLPCVQCDGVTGHLPYCIGVMLDEALAALRDVAERQREACAEYLKHWTYDEHTLSRVRATPLVTDASVGKNLPEAKMVLT